MGISSLSSNDIIYNGNLNLDKLPKNTKPQELYMPEILDVNGISMTRENFEARKGFLQSLAYVKIMQSVNAKISNYQITDLNLLQNIRENVKQNFDELKDNKVVHSQMNSRFENTPLNTKYTFSFDNDYVQTIRNKDKIEVEFSAKGFQNFSFYKSSFAQTYKTNTFNFLNFNQEFNEPNLKNATTNAVYPSTYSNISLGYFANLGLSNVSNSIFMDYATKDTKPLNLNSYANSNLLKTPYGEVTIFYDEFDDNDKLGFGTFSSNSLLFNFDSNGDGLVNANDKLFNKLKVRGYDINGNEKIAKLSDVMPSINLQDFINDEIINYNDKYIDEYNLKYPNQKIDKLKLDYRLSYNASNPYTKFKAEYRYEMIEEKELNKFFEMYANEDGWVDLTNNHNAIFNKNSAFHNFAYMKKDLNGELSLSEFNPIFSDKELDKDFSYINYQKQNFMKFYNDYYKELNSHNKNIEWLSKNLKDYDVKDADIYIDKLQNIKSPYLIAMENEFKETTGLDFSLENLNKIKESFGADPTKTANTLKDTDSVVAMKLNNNGSITLKFNSGRQIVVNELYSDTGKLLGDKDKRVGINLKAKDMSEDELNILVSTKSDSIGIKTENNRYQTLQDLGVKSIKKLSNNRFMLYLQDNTFITAKELYNITYIDRFLNDNYNNLNLNNNKLNLNNTKNKRINPEHLFYRKVDVKV